MLIREYFYKWMVATLTCCSLFLRTVAQTEKEYILPTQFQQYQSAAFQETIFAHTDKTFYLAGEVIWFKLYDVDGYFHKPLNISAVAYVELINKDQKPVLQAKIGLDNGKGNGSFMLPSWIPSGNYTFRAYTNWMKNFDPDGYFRQSLTIVNTLKDTAGFIPPNDNGYAIQFFPEGGNLVFGLPSKVAVKAVTRNGKGAGCTGIIRDQNNDSITHFQTGRFGMGNFTFTPKKGSSYHADTRLNNTARNISLPIPYDKGIVMNLSEEKEDRIRIRVYSTIPGGNPALFLFAQTHGLVKSFQVSYLSNNETTFYIDKNKLGEGVSHITIFNADKNPVCERLYFKKPDNQLHIVVQANASDFSPRQKINLSLSAKDKFDIPVKANMSISVFRIDSLQPVPKENILNYLLLTADLKGKTESPEYYFEQEDAATADNLMLTQGWSRFHWEEILQNKPPAFTFLPEINGVVINGVVTDKNSSRPVPSLSAYLTAPGKNFELGIAQSRPDGNIRWNVNRIYGSNELIVQPDSQADANYRIDWQNPFSDKFSSSLPADLFLSKEWENQLLVRSINMQAENTYRIEQKHHLLKVQSHDTLSFYGRPDKEYNLDDYTRFVTMEEVMREYVGDVRVRKQSGKSYFRVKNEILNIFFDEKPLLLLDGVPISDADKILALDPLKIKKVDVISHRFYKGPLVTSGIVSYKTYEGDMGGYLLDPNTIILQYEGLQPPRDFYTPVYETAEQEQSPLPDLRNQLYWNPDITTGTDGSKELSFYTSDFTGSFVLVIQGLTEKGLSGSTILHFNVAPAAKK